MLIEYLYATKTLDTENILLSDSNKILYCVGNKTGYMGKELSEEMKHIIDEWKNYDFSESLMLVENFHPYNVIIDDEANYSAQLIFPIFENGLLIGLAICFKLKGKYNSNCKSFSKISDHTKAFINDFLKNENEDNKTIK